MIHKIISGGQYGADQAGLKVAMDLGLKTGGMVPNGWITKFGPRPQLAKLGLIEHSTSDKYPPRTGWNVKNSDATVRFAFDFKTGGEICTYKAIRKYDKPYFDIDLNSVESGDNLYFLDLLEFFDKYGVGVLNVAGNCGPDKKYAKHVYDLTRKSLRTWIELYHNNYTPKDTWDLNDIKGEC